ncbi:hypothetical protein [Corynebacterium kozikiae]|uniref:hypothetical protein n=1 Tax=Corynebacterium kozikiae TaxID=2968469 RepID=UPI00211CFF75|nr:hypothetical protein [Corynebacterium sp. 76QC2CO]MCQ9342857.1 hypothetical protein [Corynebacterium sp. 76QC2CO]MCQ9370261.1 hypothetical protein [Corynebacterium sp. 35RC1]
MTNDSPRQAPISKGFRVGGALVAVAFAMFIFGVISVFTDGWMAPFPVTPRFILIILAIALLGGFATMNRKDEGGIVKVVALAVALLLVVLGRFVPNEPFAYWQQYWLLLYAVGAFLGAILIRNSAAGRQ